MTSPDDIRRRLNKLEMRGLHELSEAELSDRAKSLYLRSLQQTAPDAEGNAGEAYMRTVDELRRRREGADE